MKLPSRSPLLPLAAAFAVGTLSACTSPVAAERIPQSAGAGTCDAEPVQWAVGRQADQATMGRVWRESGAGLIRPIAPKQAVTEDFRPDRVNVELDASNAIIRIRCG